MKHPLHHCSLLAVCCTTFLLACQTASRTVATSDDDGTHLTFQGVEMRGEAKAFLKRLGTTAYYVGKHNIKELNYSMKGPLQSIPQCPFTVYYSPHSKTVYRIIARPDKSDVPSLTASLKQQYGEPEYNGFDTFQWSSQKGIIILKMSKNAATVLQFSDHAGEEQNRYESEEEKLLENRTKLEDLREVLRGY